MAWYNEDWLYRKKITIDHAKVDGDQTDFPMLVKLATDDELAAHAQNDGDDILFTSDDEISKLDHELIKFDGDTGELIVWVEIPTLDADADIDIYMYYGNADCEAQQNVNGTWNSGYKGVWHLDEASGGANAILDSTISVAHLTDVNSPAFGVAAKINVGIDLELNNIQYLQGTYDALKIPGNLTAEIWIKAESIPVSQAWILCGEGSPGGYGWISMMSWEGGHPLKVWRKCGAEYPYVISPDATSAGIWYHIVWIWDDDNNQEYLYVNGVQKGSAANTQTTDAPSGKVLIGYSPAAAEPFDGIVEEARISNVARPITYPLTCFNNQNSPSTFYSVGEEEVLGPLPVTIARVNYFNLPNVQVEGVEVTQAAVMRFDAPAGTHKAVDEGTIKSTPGTVNGWIKVNINGTIFYIPSYTSKTS